MSKQPGQIIGGFVFRNDGDGCLSSKYQNEDAPFSPLLESCKRFTPPNHNDTFLGRYLTI